MSFPKLKEYIYIGGVVCLFQMKTSVQPLSSYVISMPTASIPMARTTAPVSVAFLVMVTLALVGKTNAT